jgi:hypothetical protein
MENIKAFLDAVEKYGLAEEDTFVTVDLFEGRNMKQVRFYTISEQEPFSKEKFVKTNGPISPINQNFDVNKSRQNSIIA